MFHLTCPAEGACNKMIANLFSKTIIADVEMNREGISRNYLTY
jgi:hypothetical protein